MPKHWMTNMNIAEFECDQPTASVQAIERATSILQSVGVDSPQIAIWLLRQYAKFDPVHANVYEDAIELIEWRISQSQPSNLTQTPTPVVLTTLTATGVGQMLAERYADIVHPPTPQQVNQALQRLDFHHREDKKGWQLTKLGQQYGRIINVTDDRDRTRLQVRWLPTVLEQLAPLFM